MVWYQYNQLYHQYNQQQQQPAAAAAAGGGGWYQYHTSSKPVPYCTLILSQQNIIDPHHDLIKLKY
jgi:hypothetical protein